MSIRQRSSSMKGKKFLAFFLVGASLFIEHYITYGRFDREIIGHEFYGLVLMIVSLMGVWWSNLEGEWKLDSKEKEKIPDERS